MRNLLQFDRDDSGIALVVVIGAIALMVVLATAGFYFSSQTLFETTLADQHDAAFQAASSGVMVAFTDLRSKIASPVSGGTYTGSIATSSAAYTTVATLNDAQTAYECVSTGTTRDGTQEVVVATFALSSTTGTSLPWGANVFYFAGYSGGTIVANGTMTGPLYIRFDASGSQAELDFGSAGGGFVGGPVFVENGDLVVKAAPPSPVEFYTSGTITLEGNAKSTPGMILNRGWDPSKKMPITLVDVPTFLSSQLARATAQSNDNVIGDTLTANYEAQPAGGTGTYTSLATSPPNNRPNGWMRSMAPGATQSYKVVRGGLSITGSTPSFGSWSGDSHYPTTADLHDDFAYDAVNKVLYVEGTVYVDGDLNISQAVRYVGNGALVCSGAVNISASVVPATANGSDSLPEPDARHLLGIFSSGDVVSDGNNTNIVGAVYAVGRVQVNGTGSTLKGSFVAEKGLAGLGNGVSITALPLLAGITGPGLPTWGTTTATAGLAMASWRRL